MAVVSLAHNHASGYFRRRPGAVRQAGPAPADRAAPGARPGSSATEIDVVTTALTDLLSRLNSRSTAVAPDRPRTDAADWTMTAEDNETSTEALFRPVGGTNAGPTFDGGETGESDQRRILAALAAYGENSAQVLPSA